MSALYKQKKYQTYSLGIISLVTIISRGRKMIDNKKERERERQRDIKRGEEERKGDREYKKRDRKIERK